MAISDTFTPPKFYFEISQGAHFHLQFPPFLDVTTGEPFDFTADPEGAWSGRMDVRDSTGRVVASFATSGATGLMTLTPDGVVALDLSAAATTILVASTTYSGVQAKASYFAQLFLTDPADGEPWCWGNGLGRIRKQVTG